MSRELKAQEIITPSDSCITADTSSADFSTYYLSPTSGISSIQWYTAGDIAILGSSTGTNVEVKSQSTQPLRYPYGKGRLYVSYVVDSLPSCGPHVIYKDLYKTFTNDTDKIVGPTCISTGDTVTYSINPRVSVNLDAEIGIDRYKWIIPSSWVPNIVYYSADSSSITFVVGTTTGHDTLVVGVGQCNFDNGDYTDTLVLGLSIPPPILSYPSCLPANSDTLVVKWTNPPTGTFTYAWSKPSNWKTLSSTEDSIVLIVDNNPGTVSLSVINNCQSVDSSAVINRSLSTTSIISGDTCVVAGSQQTYTVTNAPVNTNLTWTIPSGNGWSYANSDTTAQTITVNVGTTSGKLYVSAAACSSVVDSLAVDLKPANPTTITGTDTLALCSTDSVTYTVNTVAGANNGYGWIFPSGWSPATDTTLSTSVKVKPDGKTSGQVKVYALGGCQNSDTLSLNVLYDTLVPPTIISSKKCSNVGLNDTTRYSISPTGASLSYGWQLPVGWSIDSTNADSSAVRIINPGDTGTFVVKALAKDSCGGVSAYTNDTLHIVGLNFTISAVDMSGEYTSLSTNAPGEIAYYWTADGAPVSLFGNTNSAIQFDPVSYPVCVAITYSNDSGCVSTTQKCVSGPTGGGEGRPATETKASVDNTNTIKVSPNPTNGLLNVQFNDATTRSVRLMDSNGKVALSTTLNNINNTLDVSNVPSGVYFLVANSQEGIAVARVVVSK
ncbi:MAG TPA: T9SS type A sorting domain-containing protein [Ferruginibacter sp.]|nr:T9SS type A sorting domain-containing protein [Ferruginibacter sp.]